MTTSTKLLKAIERAEAALKCDPQGDLHRGYREAVWAALGKLDHKGQTRRARLAIAAARRVLPALEEIPSANVIAHEVLELAEEVLAGVRDPEEAQGRYNTAIVEMNNISIQSEDQIPLSAGHAALAAFIAAINDEAFDPNAINLELTDDETDPNNRDSGYFGAVVAAGGPPWDPTSDAAARRKFWKWWLTKALEVTADYAP